jgi:hypothetical protein
MRLREWATGLQLKWSKPRAAMGWGEMTSWTRSSTLVCSGRSSLGSSSGITCCGPFLLCPASADWYDPILPLFVTAFD